MPRYNPSTIEPKWQRFWEQNRTFQTPRMPRAEKVYVLDMFPYPSGDGLHVGHPEGYTATDIMCRFWRMRGKSVMHPMGFDAFGLPAEEHAIRTNTPPRQKTEENIATFTRQLKMLGFSYDWDRMLATTDVEYFRWTQWIFLQIYDTWYDHEQQRGRPISELPISAEVTAEGEHAVRRYQDEHRLAYQSEAPVNWCPALGTVLANEEVVDGKSERGGHPVVRMPLRQWMLRITAYADRLEKDLEGLDWSEGIKKLQRDWIGRSTGAEVDFFIGARDTFNDWCESRQSSGFPRKPDDHVLRIYTTRPDTLFGATYMVIAPEHPFVERFTTPEQQAAVKNYCEAAARKSDLDRTELAKEKTGVFTGSHAINPVNGEPVPIWVADYVLISYGTGAIMAVPAHDERDFEFAKRFHLAIRSVVMATEPWLREHGRQIRLSEDSRNLSEKLHDALMQGSIAAADISEIYEEGYWKAERLGPEFQNAYLIHAEWFDSAFTAENYAINSPGYEGLTTQEFKDQIVADLERSGLGRKAVNYKLRDWLFSRQRFWGEPFPVLHELDDAGRPTGAVCAVSEKDLPVDLPHIDDYKPHGRPEPPLDKAPQSWLYPVVDGQRCKRETNTMPQWAGSCWYYLRFLDPRNDKSFVDPAIERAWMPIDLYVGGAEHAVLHLLYARFWHKVLFDRGHVSTKEPFQKLVNQGMILGAPQFHVTDATFQSARALLDERRMIGIREEDDEGNVSHILMNRGSTAEAMTNLTDEQVEKRQGQFYLVGTDIPVNPKAEKMSKSRGNVVSPDDIVKEYGADSLRLYEMFMGPLEAVKPWNTDGVNGVRGFLDRVWRMIVNERAEELELNAAVCETPCSDEQARVLHKTIKAVTQDVEGMAFNTGIARMMEFVNFFTRQEARPKVAMETLVLLLAPYAPHIAEELWRLLGHADTLAYEPWPTYDEALIRESTIEIPISINGKLRSKVTLPADCDQPTLEAAARADERTSEMLAGKTIVKTIVVPGRMVNFVVK